MATMIKQKARRSSDLELSSQRYRRGNRAAAANSRVQPRSAARPNRRNKRSQAREAPELAAKCPPEAPDAGEGGVPYDDREFRHGRSRS